MLIRLALCSVTELLGEPRDLIRALPFGEAEKARLCSISHPEAMAQSLAALWALRSLCEDPDQDLTLLRDERGKPRFADPSLPAFSLAHSGGLAVAALSEDRTPLGVDLEFPRARADTRKLAERFFTRPERDRLMADGCSDNTFLLLWTKKEAYAKLDGRGLLANLRRDLSPAAFRSYRLTKDGHAGCLSVAAPKEFTVRFSENPYFPKEIPT